jgi:hypothetical protein
MVNYMIRFVIILFTIFIALSICAGQTKTDEAKDRLEDAQSDDSDKDDSSDENYDSEDSDEGDSFFGSIAGWFFETTFKGIGSIILNIPMFTEDTMQTVRYSKYPFSNTDNYKFRSSEALDPLRFQTHFSAGRDSKNTFTSYSFNGNVHFKSWALRLKYRYIDEYKADEKINYYSGKIEGKSRVLPSMDMGVSIGVDDIQIGSDHYSGLSLGYNLELFLFKPVSINFNPNIMFYYSEYVYDTNVGINLHLNRYYLGFEYNNLDIIGVYFISMGIKTGLYF